MTHPYQWPAGARLAPTATGLVPAHLRPLALGEAKPPPKSSLPNPAPPLAYVRPPQRPARRPIRAAKLRPANAILPPAPGVDMPGLASWPRMTLSEGIALTSLCHDAACQRGRVCRHQGTPCWSNRREIEERLTRLSDARRAGLYRRVGKVAAAVVEFRRMLRERLGELTP